MVKKIREVREKMGKERLEEFKKLEEEYLKQYPEDRLETIASVATIQTAIEILKNRKGRRIVFKSSGEDEIDGITWEYE